MLWVPFPIVSKPCSKKYHQRFLPLTLYQTTKFLIGTKLKPFADNKMNLNENLKLVLGKVENVGNEENAVNQHFLLFPQCFQKPSISLSLEVRIVR